MYDKDSDEYIDHLESGVSRNDYEIPPTIDFGKAYSQDIQNLMYYNIEDNKFSLNGSPYDFSESLPNGKKYFGGFDYYDGNLMLIGNYTDTYTWYLISLKENSINNSYNNLPFGYTFLSPSGNSIIVIRTTDLDQEGIWKYEGEIAIYSAADGNLKDTYSVPTAFLEPKYNKGEKSLEFQMFDTNTSEIVTVLELEDI
ncbi:MAG: hypothetical protein Q9M91_04695 [Candidatus Dojkabacteria bacterium]|nr:hypothetical protein [Candidatus Dojkabacteria bacterium]MDQ7021108.1 hypothetical protein [Candidatus Dojkabacteria bacterium]